MSNGIVPAGRLRALVGNFSKKRILVLGDLMLDQFIQGRANRLSPEAPVPIVRVTTESLVPGGAGNVCSNLAALGAKVAAVSVAGADDAGHHLLDVLKARGIDTDAVLVDPDRPTTQKCRIIADHQQVVRYDRETSLPLPARVQARLAGRLDVALRGAHALVISDYGKGVVSASILKRAIRAARRAGVPVTVDPKVEHFKRYRGVDCITPNSQEAWAGMRLLPQEDEEAVRALGRRIVKALNAVSVLITRGEKGMTLFEKAGERVTHIPAIAKEVFDVTGAGDTVISVLTLGLACGGSLRESAVLANHAAGIVVGKLGTATASPPEILAALSRNGGRP